MSVRIIEKACVVVKFFEGYRDKAYQDEGGVWTIGYGTTKGVNQGSTITKEQALKLLEVDLVQRYNKLCKLIDISKYSDNEVVALLSFVYNLGFVDVFIGHLRTYNKSLIASKILLYNKIRINGVLVESKGLVKRRQKEHRIFTGEESA